MSQLPEMSRSDDEELDLAQSLVGRTITRALFFDTHPKDDWTEHEVTWVWLDDGRVIEFGGYGYDAWGATIRAIEVVDVPKCLHCGKEHKDREVSGPWGFKTDHLPVDSKFAWCEDGNHAAMLVNDGS